MQTIKNELFSELSFKGSKFLTYVYHVKSINEIDNYLKKIKELHPKATHWCYAYRLEADGKTYRVNDDGEPSGSAGLPIYHQFLSFDCSNILAVVVRYFGGTLLGIAGLIKAYKESTRAALLNAEWLEIVPTITARIECDYAQLSHVFNYCERAGALILSQDLGLFCVLEIEVATQKIDELKNQLTKFNVQILFP